MSGKNQHHIPGFLQRGFAVEQSNSRKIWKFEKNGPCPKKPRSIRSTASADYFYSEPSTDGAPTLDDEITAEETPLATSLIAMRSLHVGSSIQSELAAELVSHFAPRTAHLRQTIERGMRQLVSGATELFTDQDRLSALMGIDQTAPNETFRRHIAEMILGNPAIMAQGLPSEVIERMAFYLAKEGFETTVAEALPEFRRLFGGWIDAADQMVRSGHNKALAKRDGPNMRREFLATLKWHIEPAPTGGAILPDCVVLTVGKDGNVTPLMLAETDDISAVIMPISTQALLVGHRDQSNLPPDFAFNCEAARTSHRFFLAAANIPQIAALQSRIDERASSLVDEAVAHAFKDFIPVGPFLPEDEDEGEQAPSANEPDSAEAAAAWGYEISLIDCGDETTTAKIVDETKHLIESLSHSLPLHRLNGITFTSDYPAALQALDRGLPNVAPPQTVEANVGVGIAQTVIIVRDDVVMCRIVMNSGIAHALIGDDDKLADWAIAVIVHQLSLVAITEIFDVTLPGVLLKPVTEPLQGWLYGAVGAAIDGYMASYFSAGFGDAEETADTYRQLLIEALDRMRSTVLPARLEYRYHGDLDRFLAVTTPTIRHVLLFSGDLLGHCASLGIEPVEPDSPLAITLKDAGLAAWLPRYQADLEAVRTRLGRWQSFDEFLALTLHVERLMWQLGIIPWTSGEGLRVAVPLGTDAEALIAAESRG